MKMITRRGFSKLAGVTAGAILVPQLSQAQKDEPAKLPPSIAQLKSRKDEATPITLMERQERQERAQHLMRENKIDAIFLAGGTSLSYFTNIRWGNSERLFAAVLPAKGEAFFVCPAFEEERAREQIATGPAGVNASVLTWQEHEDPYRLVAAGLRDMGIGAGRLGVEERMNFVFSDGIAKAAPEVSLTSATPVTAGCRMIKSAPEPSDSAGLRGGVQGASAWDDAVRLCRADCSGVQQARLPRRGERKRCRVHGPSARVDEASSDPRGNDCADR